MRGGEEQKLPRGRMPAAWESELSDDYEWIPLRLPPDVTRISASTRLSIEAEYRGWELTRVRAYTDGSRRVLLRRKKTAGSPGTPDQPAM
ncbi:MAG: dihydroorotate dehydrogenase [Actinobacteria bacterium]|nr:dihydroorotate dehydrogenase [Actinomycetota bacterium]